MNNTELYNKIMKGVKKSLNEGFKDWKEYNIPKFDDARFKSCMEALLKVLFPLFTDLEIVRFFFLSTEDSGAHKAICKFAPFDDMGQDDKKMIEEQNYDGCINEINERAKQIFREAYAEKMQKCILAISVSSKKWLNKYISSSLNVNRNKVDDCEFISVKEGEQGGFVIYITMENILNHVSEIIKWLD